MTVVTRRSILTGKLNSRDIHVSSARIDDWLARGPDVPRVQDKDAYITSLELADAGDFPAFVRYLGGLAAQRSYAAADRAELILRGRTHNRHSNGGVTAGGVYHQPEEEPNPAEPGTGKRPQGGETSFGM